MATLITVNAAIDMIHMGSDHRSEMATFVIKSQRKNGSRETQTRNDKQRGNTVKNNKDHTDDKKEGEQSNHV